MSKQLSVDYLPYVKALSLAVRQPDQPATAFKALDRAMQAVIGHKLLTVLLYHDQLQELERFYSSDLDSHPISGRKKVEKSAWSKQLLIEQHCYIGYNAADIQNYFPDYELIHSLGCDSILNVPVVYDGKTLGTVNLLHEENWYEQSDTEVAIILSSVTTSAYLQVLRSEGFPMSL